MTPPMGRRTAAWIAVAVSAGTIAACVEIGTGPNEPAAIELPPFPSPSVVVGDTLRDLNGVVAPVRAIVRNVRGEQIADVAVTYLYAPLQRDSALSVDPTTGIVRALRATSSDARIAARVGGNLQVLRSVIVTQRPDTLTGGATVAELRTVQPDTGRTQAGRNTSADASVTVSHREGTVTTGVNAWPVRFELVSPANPANDTSAAVFLVSDNGTASVLDTTDAQGIAGRRVRVRAARFPTVPVDTVVVRATTTYRGKPLAGSPIIIKIPVRRGT